VSRLGRYELLALDLDGTILGLDLAVDPRDTAAIDESLEAGLRIVACTGRPFPGALPWVSRLHLVEPVVCYQGAEVRGLDGSMLLDHGVPHDLAMEVVRYCRQRDLHVQTYRDDRLLVERDRAEARAYAGHAGMEINVVPDLDKATGPTTPKVVVVAAQDVVEALLPELRERWEGRLNVVTSMPTYIEVTSLQADKGLALEFLCRRLGIPRERTAAAGDGRNDVSMIRWAGLGVAVEGAPEEVRAAAGMVIGGPGSGGIAQLLEHLKMSG
jgi:Cof subfamily protein (haloacid dehalogenase superfamily)